MIRPIPSGTRDVLPDEMRELRAISEPLRATFERYGYGEVYTPALEYESTLATAVQAGVDPSLSGARPAYRLFDENGEVLVLRSDMTIPIARVAATRYAGSQPPLRFCYLAHAYRGVRPQRGQPREFLQAGIELIGSPAPEGTAEALTVLCAALDDTGLESYRVGMGDAGLYPALLDSFGVPDGARTTLMNALVRRDFVALEHEIAGLGLASEAAALLVEIPQRRGGADVLSAPDSPAADAVGRMARVRDLLDERVGERIIFDLGLTRGLGYYTGAVFEVYDPALGAPLGGGGRYDDLLARFGRPLPAVGFGLNVERLHLALTGEERYR
ncbi:MAG: ATP phosphoribosyltransferase regulatory subunit [Solirubrobacteraceae bacterium]